MSNQFFKRCSATLLAMAMSAGAVTPALATDLTDQSKEGETENQGLPKNEIFFDEPASEGDLPGSTGSWAGGYDGANRWQQRTLPIGNSLMGANVYGEYTKERLTFNQKTVWTGGPSESRPNYNGGNISTKDGMSMSEIYKTTVEKFKTNASDKDNWANKLVGEAGQNGYGSYQRLADIYIDFDRFYNSEEWDKYWEKYWSTGVTKIDDRDSSISYTNWSDWNKGASWYEGTEKFTETIGAELTMTFTGTAIRMIGASNSTCGFMDVYIDGEKVAENVNLREVGNGDGSILFSKAELKEGEHTIRVVNVEPLSGTAKKISYDYFEIKTSDEGSSVDALDLNPNNASETGIVYTGNWSNYDRSSDTGSGAGWINKDEMWLEDSPGASISYTFTGTGIALKGALHNYNNMGSFTWKIDDGEEHTVDCKKSSGGFELATLFSQQNLENKEHTVLITSVSGKLSLDALEVTKLGGSLQRPEEPEYHTEVSNYKRALDLDNSVATVEYDRDNTHYYREYIASHPDNVIATKMTASGEKDLDFDFSIPLADEGTATTGKTSITTAQISDNGKSADLMINGEMNDNQMKLATLARVIVDAGTITYDEENKRLNVRGASEAVIYVSAATDYEDNYPTYRTGESQEEVFARAARDVNAATAKGYAKVKADHQADYKNIYDRVKLDLGQTKPTLANDDLLKAYNQNNSPLTESERRYLEQLLFQYGRYLQISSTRENAQGRDDQDLPANLQGVWNIYTGPFENVPWGSDYHMNVNMQMNYWPTYSTNMAECALPMIDYEDGLREPGRVTASTYFGIDNSNGQENGYTAHTQNTPFGWTCPGWAFSWGWSPAAVPWMLQNVYEYYEYTQDVDYLREKIFPMMKEQAKLYATILTEVTSANGVTRLTTVPAYSAEHGPYTAGNTYENTLSWQLFNDCVEAATALNADDPDNPVADAEQIAAWQNIMDQLKPIEVGESGQIKEWYDETTLGTINGTKVGQSGHRHMSHLLGLFPGDLINSDHPEYLEAAKVSLTERGRNATGWGMGQRINAWARTKDGDEAFRLIESLFRSGMYVNLWDSHAPFQIDGNFGYTSGVAEMLMQSNASTIELLPAMPEEWSEGSVDGIVARGNFELDYSWTDGELGDVEVISKAGGTCKLNNPVLDDEGVTVTDSKGTEVEVTDVEGKEHAIQFETTKGEIYYVTRKTATSVKIQSSSNLVTPGGSLNLTLAAVPAGLVINSAVWTAADADGEAIDGVTITSESNPAQAVLNVAAGVANGTEIVVKVTNVNGNAAATDQITLTVGSSVDSVVDLGQNKFVTVLPDTAEFDTVDDQKVMNGYMDINDPDRIVTKALTSGESFTASSWLYVPAAVKDINTGSVSDDGKYSTIVSIGDESFAMRLYTTKDGSNTYCQAYIQNASGYVTAGSSNLLSNDFFDQWHEISAVYDSTAQTFALYIDGEQIESLAATSAPLASELPLEIGHMSDKSERLNDFNFSNIKILNKALDADQIKDMSDGLTKDMIEEDDVVLWVDFAEPATSQEREALAADLAEAEALNAADYTEESWNTFAQAKDNAASLNAVYSTKANLAEVKAALASAKESLVPADINLTLLRRAENKGSALDLDGFNATEEEKNTFNTLLREAQELLESPTTQDAVNAKAKAINNAMLALRKTPDKSALDSLSTN